MNRNSLGHYVALVVVLAFGLIYALPNVFGDDPAVQIADSSGEPVTERVQRRAQSILDGVGITPKSVTVDEGKLLLRMDSADDQLAASDALKAEFTASAASDLTVALSSAQRTPGWLLALGAEPMSLGLDLRGGVHILMQVDVDTALDAAMERYETQITGFLREGDFRYRRPSIDETTVRIPFRDAATADDAAEALRNEFTEFEVAPEQGDPAVMTVSLTEAELNRQIDFWVKQNITTLRNRVNQLGVAEPLVQRQGKDRIVVQLPGVQDPSELITILQATATLEYRAVAYDEDAEAAARTGRAPPGTMLAYHRYNRTPHLLRRSVIATGGDITDARPTVDQETGSPAVAVTLSGRGARNMQRFTEKNVGRPMAVLFKETKYTRTIGDDGEAVLTPTTTEEIISIANIQGVFGARFRTTGLESREASRLSQLLRAGALAAPVGIIEERTIGPSLGAENIEKGEFAVLLGFVLVVIFMVVYYKLFGLIANVALFVNLALILAVLGLMQATLTLPGIAGILLTVGMAVDANVLIFQRVREELAAGARPGEAIAGGYDKAFSTILDANVTTLIAALVLFVFGTGPIKGFAITLAIGIVASMLTAIYGTRILVNLVYGGGRKPERLSI